MPAILRNSLPKYNASHDDIRPYAFYDRVGARTVGLATVFEGSNGMWVCNIMPWGRCVWCCLLEISITDVLGVSQEAQYETIECE